MLFQKLSGKKSGVGTAPPVMVEDVFATTLFTASNSDQSLINGINLSAYGGLFWGKSRSTASHYLADTARGGHKILRTDSTAGTQDYTSFGAPPIINFNGDGVTIRGGFEGGAPSTNVAWTFRKAPKFFDVVTWTGNGGTQTISHNLGCVPGLIICKSTNATGTWMVQHIDRSGTFFRLNTTGAEVGLTKFFSVTDTSFNVNTSGSYTAGPPIANVEATSVNTVTYVAYLFAHDTSAGGIIQCGSASTPYGSSTFVNLGWEPQFVLMKYANDTSEWRMLDIARGFDVYGGTNATNPNRNKKLLSNSSGAESGTELCGYPTSNGFYIRGFADSGTTKTCIYMAIRRGPMRPPTVGTQVYNAIARTGTGAAATVTGVGFPPDSILITNKNRNSSTQDSWYNRLTGNLVYLSTASGGAENVVDATHLTSFNMDGMTVGGGWATNYGFNGGQNSQYINHFFRRAPGFFDVVAYAGTGASGLQVSHSLGVTPELTLIKSRTGARNWEVAFNFTATQSERLQLTTTGSGGLTDYGGSGQSFSQQPTATTLYMNDGTDGPNVNTNGENLVAYLFATLAGVSKVGSYTGNGTSQTISCGFAAGARFVLVKRTDSTGDWFVWDSTRGIVAGNDPHLSLNTTVTEVTTDDSIDPDNSGFIVNQLAATNINVNAGTYIFLAIA